MWIHESVERTKHQTSKSVRIVKLRGYPYLEAKSPSRGLYTAQDRRLHLRFLSSFTVVINETDVIFFFIQLS